MDKYELMAEKLRAIILAIDELVENGDVLEEYTAFYRNDVVQLMVSAECHELPASQGTMLGLMAKLGACGPLYNRKKVMDATIEAEMFYATSFM